MTTMLKKRVQLVVSRVWYGLSVVQKLRPVRETLKLPSLLSRRWRLWRETTEPKPRSRVSSRGSGRSSGGGEELGGMDAIDILRTTDSARLKAHGMTD